MSSKRRTPKFSPGGWKRARLKQHVQHSLAYIQLIDYGNDEQVPENSLFQLSAELGTWLHVVTRGYTWLLLNTWLLLDKCF